MSDVNDCDPCKALLLLLLYMIFFSHNITEKPWERTNDTEERNEKAKKAYESLMTVTLRKPTSPEYQTFSNLVKQKAEQEYNFLYEEDEVRK